MSDCIVCGEPLRQIEKDMLMTNHAKCNSAVIELALYLLSESDTKTEDK